MGSLCSQHFIIRVWGILYIQKATSLMASGLPIRLQSHPFNHTSEVWNNQKPQLLQAHQRNRAQKERALQKMEAPWLEVAGQDKEARTAIDDLLEAHCGKACEAKAQRDSCKSSMPRNVGEHACLLDLGPGSDQNTASFCL